MEDPSIAFVEEKLGSSITSLEANNRALVDGS